MVRVRGRAYTEDMGRYSLIAALLAGCLHTHHIAIDGAVLGRVVIYRNGVAFYERRATVENGRLAVHVPRDRVDDFLKSLTVVDPSTRKPLSVSIPRKEADDGNYLTMTLETPERRHADVLLTYVTEAPAWKPSYRVVVGDKGKVMLEGWAIVDNVSGEDWKNVLVGVGASSALSFRYDLWSVRHVDRDLLQGESKFAVAPPTGISPYTDGQGEELVTLGGDDLGGVFSGSSSLENQYVVDGVNTTGLSLGGGAISGVVTDSRSGEKLAGVTVIASSPSAKQTLTAITDEKGAYTIAGASPGKYLLSFYYGDVTVERNNVDIVASKTTPVYQKINTGAAGGETIKIQDTAPTIDPTSTTQGITIDKNYMRNIPASRTFEDALGAVPGTQSDGGSAHPSAPPKRPDPLLGISDRVLKAKKDVAIETPRGMEKSAEEIKNKLVDQGIPASRIRIVNKDTTDHRVRVLAVAQAQAAPTETTGAPPAATHGDTPETPVGESHFIADRPMNVRAGTSAMVSMLHGETTGGVVYLYDPISDRGDDRFAFKAVRLDNPTDDTLEPGPITVYGDGRFIGEGITEPVPPKASVVVPFAADRQVLVSKHDDDSDRIAKLVTVERGVVTAEIQHRRATKFTVTSRLAKPAKLYLRHRLESGWSLVESPPRHMKVGDSTLFEVDLDAGETKYVTIAEATPVEKTLDLGSPDALDMMKVYIDEPAASPELKKQITGLLETHRAAADLVDKIQTLRDQLAEYRTRAGELHGQLVTLKLVKTSGPLMAELKNRLADTSERMQKATIAIVDAQEQLMLARVKFQNQLADLHLTDITAKR